MTNLRNRMAAKNHREAGDWLPGRAPKKRRPAPKPPLSLIAAKTSRLAQLVVRHSRGAAEMQAMAGSLTGENPRQEYTVALLCAGFLLVSPCRYGLDWEEVKAVLDNHGRGGTPEVYRCLMRAGRAMRLIDRLVTAGCVRRREV